MKLEKFIKITILVIACTILTSMAIRTPPLELNLILQEYNDINYKFVATNYYTIKEKINSLPETIIYAIANSLYKVSNFSEVLNFSNIQLKDKFLDNNIKLLISFSLSELGDFSNSQNILKQITNEYFKYFDNLINYYFFRNEIFQNNATIVKDLNPKLLKDEDIRKISELIPYSDDNFCIFISSLLIKINRSEQSKNVVLKILSKKYSSNDSILKASKNLISSGFVKEGYQLILTLPLPTPVKNFYQANLMLLNKYFSDSQIMLEKLLKNYSSYEKTLKDYNISLDDILVSLASTKVITPIEFENFALKNLKNSGYKFKTYILRNYKIISPQTYLTFITNYFEKADLTYQTKAFITAFISYNLHQKNYNELKEFSKYMLKRTKNTYWEKEFYLLTFILEKEKKKEIAEKILIDYPFTYEYIRILDYIKQDKETLQEIIPYLLLEYQRTYKDYKTNSTIENLNRLIGMSFVFKTLNISYENSLNLI
ncbi:MAG: hypothetical protein ACPL4C_05835, partial [Brevinematia bacterium]